MENRENSTRAGVLARYGARLPLTKDTPMISLSEGSTPCIPAPRLAATLGLSSLYLKFEGMNPTGSFKDRGMVVAIAKAVEEGATCVICASTGNTSASAAAYAARAGLSCLILVPKGKISKSKLLQAQMHGATVVSVGGSFDTALSLVRSLGAAYRVAIVNSINPYRIEGQKTAAFEIVDELGQAPDLLVLPVGNAGNITAYWKGFVEEKAAGRIPSTPRMIGGQAAGAAPIVLGHPVESPETVASAIRIGNPASWKQALAALGESDGIIDMVEDEDILSAQRLLARAEGVFCEPASATSVAILGRLLSENRLPRDSSAVCVLTGHGLKDPSVEPHGHSSIDFDGDLAGLAKACKLVPL